MRLPSFPLCTSTQSLGPLVSLFNDPPLHALESFCLSLELFRNVYLHACINILPARHYIKDVISFSHLKLFFSQLYAYLAQ